MRIVPMLVIGLALSAPRFVVAAELPNGASTVEAIPMMGPFTTLEAYCAKDQQPLNTCLDSAAERTCGAPRGTGAMSGAFLESRVLGGCDLALRTNKGWFVVSTEGLPAWASFLHNGDRYLSELKAISRSNDGKSVLIDGVFVHSTNAAKMPWLRKPPRDDWYECEERLFVCAIGVSGPSCAGPFPLSFTAYCRDGEKPTQALHRKEPHDFHIDAALDGDTLGLTSSSAQPRSAPLPGWAVTASDAPRTKGIRRELSPNRVKLEFP